MEPTNNVNRQLVAKAYQELRGSIFAIFRQACISEDNCEDLVQEVFMKILGLDVIVEDQLKGLAVKMAYQKRTDYLRHRACINKVKNDSLWRMEQSYTNQEAEVNDILQVELRAMHCMSDMDCRVYRMTRFEDKTADEIALELHLSKRAVESRLYRTRNLVRERVRQQIAM